MFKKIYVIALLAPLVYGASLERRSEVLTIPETRASKICVNLDRDVRVINLPRGYRAKVYNERDCYGRVLLQSSERRITDIPRSAESVYAYRDNDDIVINLSDFSDSRGRSSSFSDNLVDF
ncbi:hypothetical protein K502DRAFT_365076 [Neoconidiobolus thromboides FSU 785]|nr:hypothetical protein K502DRAFT_365076 [Neoconidiobolus thromboides FSU 785]